MNKRHSKKCSPTARAEAEIEIVEPIYEYEDGGIYPRNPRLVGENRRLFTEKEWLESRDPVRQLKDAIASAREQAVNAILAHSIEDPDNPGTFIAEGTERIRMVETENGGCTFVVEDPQPQLLEANMILRSADRINPLATVSVAPLRLFPCTRNVAPEALENDPLMALVNAAINVP